MECEVTCFWRVVGGKAPVEKRTPDMDAIARSVRENVSRALDGQSAEEIARRTGFTVARVASLQGGELPDGYEVMALEAEYGQTIWPRCAPTGSRKGLKFRGE